MEKQEILQQVLSGLAERFPTGDTPLTPSTRLSDTVMFDSLTVLEVIMFLEESFGLHLTTSDLDDIETPERIAELIERKCSGG